MKTFICNASQIVTMDSFILILSPKSALRAFKYPFGLTPLRETQQNKWVEANRNINPQHSKLYIIIIFIYTKFVFVEVRLTKPVSPIFGFLSDLLTMSSQPAAKFSQIFKYLTSICFTKNHSKWLMITWVCLLIFEVILK